MSAGAEDDDGPEEVQVGFIPSGEGLPCPINQLHPNLPDIIINQASMNIGTIGHVAHGKTTLVKAISTISTIKFSDEKKK